MSAVSCPVCAVPVVLPMGVSPSEMVRCPDCGSQYAASRVVLVAAGTAEQREPCRLERGASSGGGTPEAAKAASSAAHDAPWELTPWDHVPAHHDAIHAETAADDATPPPLPPPVPPPVHEPEHYDFGDRGEPAARMPGAVPGASWRNFQESPSGVRVVGRLVGMVVCGMLGVAFAYLMLSVISPSRFDYLGLWGGSEAASATEHEDALSAEATDYHRKPGRGR